MPNDEIDRVLGYLYQIVPGRKSAIEISREVFNGDDKIPLNEILRQQMDDGNIYQWRHYPEDKAPFPMQDQYGMTIKGILFYGKFSAEKKPSYPLGREQKLQIEKDQASEGSEIEFSVRQNYPRKHKISWIVLIVIAVALLILLIAYIKR